MADAVNGGTEAVAAEDFIEASKVEVAEKIDVSEGSVEGGRVRESREIREGDGLAPEVEEKEVDIPVLSADEEFVAEVAVETTVAAPEIKGGEELIGDASGGTAYDAAKELEEASLSMPTEPAVVDQEEITESMDNQAAISVSRRTVPTTSWGSCRGLFDVLQPS